MPSQGGRKENIIMAIKFCTKCGKKLESVGREVICPACKQAAAEETKRVAVLRAKKASWAGESVPVRISGRASTLIREFSKAHDVPFAGALDELLKSTSFFQSSGKKWEEITPYKSHRRDKSTTETTQDAPQKVKQDAPQASKASKPQDGAQTAKVAKVTSKNTTSKAAAGRAGKKA